MRDGGGVGRLLGPELTFMTSMDRSMAPEDWAGGDVGELSSLLRGGGRSVIVDSVWTDTETMLLSLDAADKLSLFKATRLPLGLTTPSGRLGGAVVGLGSCRSSDNRNGSFLELSFTPARPALEFTEIVLRGAGMALSTVMVLGATFTVLDLLSGRGPISCSRPPWPPRLLKKGSSTLRCVVVAAAGGSA